MKVQKFGKPVIYFSIFQNLIAISINKNIEIYTLDDWNLVYRLYHKYFIYKMAFLSPTLLVTVDGKHIIAWDLEYSRSTRSGVNYGKQVWSRFLPRIVYLSFQNNILVVGCRTGYIYTLSITDGAILSLYGPLAPFRSLVYIGDSIVTLSEDERELFMYTPPDMVPYHRIQYEDEIHHIQISPHQKYLVLSKSQEIAIFTSTFEKLWAHVNEFPLPNLSICFSSDDRMIATVGPRFRKICIFDTQTGQIIRSLAGHSSIIFHMSFYGDNKLVTTAWDHTIRTWKVFHSSSLLSLLYSQQAVSLSKHLRLKLF